MAHAHGSIEARGPGVRRGRHRRRHQRLQRGAGAQRRGLRRAARGQGRLRGGVEQPLDPAHPLRAALSGARRLALELPVAPLGLDPGAPHDPAGHGRARRVRARRTGTDPGLHLRLSGLSRHGLQVLAGRFGAPHRRGPGAQGGAPRPPRPAPGRDRQDAALPRLARPGQARRRQYLPRVPVRLGRARRHGHGARCRAHGGVSAQLHARRRPRAHGRGGLGAHPRGRARGGGGRHGSRPSWCSTPPASGSTG